MAKIQGSYTVRRRKDGVDGINSATVTLYNRTSGTPNSAPNGNTTYNFSTGILSGQLNMWTQYIPTDNGAPCYVITATAASKTETDTILPSDWSTVRKLVESGTNGIDAVTIEIDKINTSIDANGNAFNLTVTIMARRGASLLTYGTGWNFTRTNIGLTDDGDNADGMINFTGFEASTVKVGYCDITVTVGSATYNRRITISRNSIQGCIARTSEWAAGVEYRNDSALVTFPRYLDIVVITSGTNQLIYECIVTHTAGTFATDLAAVRWLSVNNMQPIFTPLLLANQAVIKFMQGQQLLMMSGGTIQAGISALVTAGLDYRFWSGAPQPVDANWSVDELGKMKALAGIFGLFNIIGGSIIGDNLKITNEPIGTKAVVTAPHTYTIPFKEFPGIGVENYGADLTVDLSSYSMDTDEILFEQDTVLPLARLRSDAYRLPAMVSSNGYSTCTLVYKLEVINNGVIVGSNTSAGYPCGNTAPSHALTEGANTTSVSITKGTLKLRATIYMSNPQGWNAGDALRVAPIITGNDTGLKDSTTFSTPIYRSMIGLDGVFSYPSANRWLYFRGAGDANDEFEVKLNTISILLKGGKATISGLPTSSSGLTAGMMYRDSNGFLKIV